MQTNSDDLLLAGVDQVDDLGLLAEAAAQETSAAIGGLLAAQAIATTAYPYSTVVRITDEIGGKRFQGSGILISPDEVLTASHVVYQTSLGTATSIDVVPAYDNGNAPFGHAAGTVAHYSQVGGEDDSIYQNELPSDYAIIHLSTPFAGLGAMGIQPDFAGGAVHVTGYPGSAGGAMVDSTQSVTLDPNYTLLDGTSTGQGSSGGPVWIYAADGKPYIVGLVSAEALAPSANGQTLGWNVQITGSVLKQITAWERQDAGAAAPSVQVYDMTLGKRVPDALTHLYVGPVAGLQEQYIDVASHSVNITANSPNYFIHTGRGNDAITLLSGTNIADGGAGSNVLIGGTGTDTFYLDDRRATSDIWSTVSNFHVGDSATVWGVSPSLTALNWADNQGAAGSTGLTLHATRAGQPTASLTLAGFSQTDMASGRLSVQYGHDASSLNDYLYIHANR